MPIQSTSHWPSPVFAMVMESIARSVSPIEPRGGRVLGRGSLQVVGMASTGSRPTVATGKSYRLEATMREAPHLSATIEISTLTRAEEDAYRRTFEVLKRHIADTRVRLFTHILAALDAELWSTAVDLLASFPKEGAAKRLGLDECRRAVDDAFGEAASLRTVIEALSR